MSSLPLNSTTLPIRSPTINAKEASVSILADEDGPLEATRDARRIVRLVQCPKCSYPLLSPVALPCGNSVCKACLPKEVHLRHNVSYPPNRSEGFSCPVPTCGGDHVLRDCGTDYVLKTITEMVQKAVGEYRITAEASDVLMLVEEQNEWAMTGVSSLQAKEVQPRLLPGGRLSATYTLAEMGELQYAFEVSYTPMSATNKRSEDLDFALLEHLKGALRDELDCQICRNIYLDPYTTTCGHTFCRKCIQSVLENTLFCPTCRRTQELATTIRSKNPPINLSLARIISGLCPEAMALRADISSLDEELDKPKLDTPLFICTLSFPEMPTFLHVFEPRYRLMVERAMQKDRRFGMILHNPTREPQGHLGRVHFYEYGTLLEIVSLQRLPDGRSLMETRGISKFKVLKHATLDGYIVGDIERVDDISIAEEEALEIRETTTTPGPSSSQVVSDAPPHHLKSSRDPQTSKADTAEAQRAEINTSSTQHLFEICSNFVKKMEGESAPWLHSRVYAVYGGPPDDPAIFPWWFANVLPLAEVEKYKLLQTSSVRERLKICALWARVIESQKWYVARHIFRGG
ncbi:related to ATP-dependent protease (CrgA) [Phialocephala subalpina]|uniref:Related to ATP-dependent protease (CrgA) n=1 Tax=Phialocephala subalpina TaxID=576137 RepID=A0A1L7X2F5_9HELO|nr:related to ATP-dependent protease (CrgA) [Phialocephala subalpina]